MDNESHQDITSQKRTPRKTTRSRAKKVDNEIPESFSAIPEPSPFTFEYSDSQSQLKCEEWSPQETFLTSTVPSMENSSNEENLDNKPARTRKIRGKSTKVQSADENSTDTVPNLRRSNRYKSENNPLTPTEIKVNNTENIPLPEASTENTPPSQEKKPQGSFQNSNSNHFRGTDYRNTRNDNNQERNNNGNNRNYPQNNRNLNNRKKPASTVRIGQFSIGFLRGLESLENKAKLDAFADSMIDTTQTAVRFNDLLEKSNDDLTDFANSIDIVDASSRGRILDNYMNSVAANHQPILVCGILESMEGGDGIITYSCDHYKIRAKSTFVPRCLIQSLGLRRGQNISAYIHPPLEQSSCPFAIRIVEVQGKSPETAIKFPRFKDLIPYYPTERIFLEQPGDTSNNSISLRIIDLLSPIGLGQRGLIVAAPKTGKTTLLQAIANAIISNQTKAKLIVLLIDERPEEVTDFSRQVPGAEIISSTFDESAENHVHAAELVIENARRRVEAGEHVIILLDSITRLARAYNTEQPSSGKVLSGGIEANALQLPKRFFGSARNIEGGGSLTIIATALVETGSRMDEVIFEEFKGTGNMELHLDRALADKRIFPAINIDKSGTRKEELLYHPDEIVKIYNLRRAFQGVPQGEAMEMLLNRIKKTASNVEFLMNINR